MYWENRQEMGHPFPPPQERCPWFGDQEGGGGGGKNEHAKKARPWSPSPPQALPLLETIF